MSNMYRKQSKVWLNNQAGKWGVILGFSALGLGVSGLGFGVLNLGL